MIRLSWSLSSLAVGISVLFLALLLISCRSEDTSIADTVPIIPASAALETIVQFNQSDLRSSPQQTATIPQAYWAEDITQLEPQDVLWHNNNLVVLFPRNSSNIDGVYVQVPISSFYAGKARNLFTLTGESGAAYLLVIQGK